MKQSNIIIVIIILIIAALIAGGIIYLRQYIPKYRWWVSMSYKSEQPYGLKTLYDILEEQTEKSEFKTIVRKPDTLFPPDVNNSLYMLIGSSAYYDSATAQSFIHFIERGNEAFIATEYYPMSLLRLLTERTDSSFDYQILDTSMILAKNKYSEKEYEFHFQYLKDTVKYSWSYIDLSMLNSKIIESSIDTLGIFDQDKTNLYKLSVGKGTVYFLTTPILLCNFYLITDKGLEYTDDILSLFKKPDQIIWDESSKVPDFVFNQLEYGNNPFRFILSKPPLRWAWFISIMSVILYMFFTAKRRQNPIPLTVENKNTSVEFAKAVGTLYYSHKNNQKLATDLIQLFLAYIRNRYHLNIKAERKILARQLASKSEVSEQKILSILNRGFALRFNPDPENEDIIRLHREIEEFYQNCK